MPNQIIDQYTDRADLSYAQKWRLRHPEHRIKHASEMRVWRDKNPGAWAEIVKRHQKKKHLERAMEKAKDARYNLLNRNSGEYKGKRAEIMKLFSKGKSIADIVIWTRIPASVVLAVIGLEKSVAKPLDRSA